MMDKDSPHKHQVPQDDSSHGSDITSVITELEITREELEDWREKYRVLEKNDVELQHHMANQQAQLDGVRIELAKTRAFLKTTLSSVYSSWSWRLTAPLRWSFLKAKKIAERISPRSNGSPEAGEDSTPLLVARSAPLRRKKILYLDDHIPHPEFGSGFPRAREIVNMMIGLQFDVTLIPLQNSDSESYESAHQVVSPKVEIILGCGRKGLQRFLSSRKNYFDVYWVSRPANMSLLDHCLSADPSLKENVHVVYDAEAVFALRDQTEKKIKGVPLSESLFHRKLEKERILTRHADTIVSVSKAEEAVLLENNTSKNSVVISHAVEPRPTASEFSERQGLLFVGSLAFDHSPNVDSILWFVHQVWKSIRDQLPGIHLHIIGRAGASSLQSLPLDGITFHGSVRELAPWYDRSRVFIAPTRYSAGIPLKVLEAASFGLPAVVTEQLQNQLGWTQDTEVGVARGYHESLPADFTAQVIRMYTEQELWTQVREGALARIRSDHSRKEIQNQVLRALTVPA